MKKVLIAVLVAIASLCWSPQAKCQSEIIWGVKGGINASWVPGMAILEPDYTYIKTHIGGYGGLIFRLDTPGSWFFQSELLYDLKGHRTRTVYYPDYWSTYSFNLNYIELPLMAGVKAAGERLNIMFGPSLGYCVYGEEAVNSSDAGKNRAKSPYYAPFQVNGVLQFSYFVLDYLSVDIRLDVGFTKVMNESVSKQYDYLKARNSSVGIGVSYYFGL